MDFVSQPTEAALTAWRYGGTQAERLCASLLHSEGYKRVDPQCPLGGPDGIKDVVFELNRWKYVAACYFPTTSKAFPDVKSKFEDDLKGVKKNSAIGIAFFTNQRLTPGEKKKLEAVAKQSNAKLITYHSEAIQAILDSPRGYGMRLEFLRIPMKPEEQASFISQFGSEISAAMNQNTDTLNQISNDVSQIRRMLTQGSAPTDSVLHVIPSQLASTFATRAVAAELAHSSDKSNLKAKTTFLTQQLDSEILGILHRGLSGDGHNDLYAGNFRTVGVWIGNQGSTPESARYIPPDADAVPEMIDSLLLQWRDSYSELMGADQEQKIAAIVAFHHQFLRIHPYLDGNGRVARLLLEQQARELLNIDRRITLTDSAAYFQALQNAHDGKMTELTRIITQSLIGTWAPSAENA